MSLTNTLIIYIYQKGEHIMEEVLYHKTNKIIYLLISEKNGQITRLTNKKNNKSLRAGIGARKYGNKRQYYAFRRN